MEKTGILIIPTTPLFDLHNNIYLDKQYCCNHVTNDTTTLQSNYYSCNYIHITPEYFSLQHLKIYFLI